MHSENTSIFRDICVAIPKDKFCLDCLVKGSNKWNSHVDLDDLSSFEKAHPILWASRVFKFQPKGKTLFIIAKKFCKEVLHIREERMKYLFGFSPYPMEPEKKDFLSRLFFISHGIK